MVTMSRVTVVLLESGLFRYNTTQQGGERGRYGLGAGPSPRNCSDGQGYIADQIGQGTSYCRIYSPYITVGYLSLVDHGVIVPQILALLEDGEAVLPVPGTLDFILWRKSMLDPSWHGHITMVDFSSEVRQFLFS